MTDYEKALQALDHAQEQLMKLQEAYWAAQDACHHLIDENAELYEKICILKHKAGES